MNANNEKNINLIEIENGFFFVNGEMWGRINEENQNDYIRIIHGLMNYNGCSTNKIPGAEKFEFYYLKIHGKKTKRIQYDYRHKDGTLFSCDCRTLKECHKKVNDHFKEKIF